MRRAQISSPASIFDAAIHPAFAGELAEAGLEVIGRPGLEVPEDVRPGDFAIRRALGEGRLAIVGAVERVDTRALLEAAGVPCEGFADGIFAEVDFGPGARRAGLRLAGPNRTMRRDTVLMRPIRVRPSRAVLLPFEDVPPPQPLAILLASVYALRGRAARSVREESLRAILQPTTGTSPLADELLRSTTDLVRRQSSLPAGSARAAAQAALFEELAGRVLAAVERVFILDPQRSALELLEPAERDRFLGFAWHADDFPGKPTGPNEARAEQMFSAITRLRRERRANQGDTAVVRLNEFDAAMQKRVRDALVEIPGEHGLRLNRDASASYVLMRAGAALDGVTLSINNSYRPAAVAQANATRAANAAAVASFSAHTLGVAVDLNMSAGTQRFAEVSTRPFANLVSMYAAPAYKWMFLRGETHGWFPYRREPWHWEYNPEGFRERFRRADAQAAAAAPAPTRESEGEVVTDPIAPLRTPLAIAGGVGRGGRNAAADVRAVQDRLVELRVLDGAAATAEKPEGTAAVGETTLPKTIDAIERFQRQLGIVPDGVVQPTSPTRIDLDRAIPLPTTADLTALATERRGIAQAVARGLSIGGPVGATATGNAAADVRAVQQRLVALGALSATHGETPSSSAPVQEAALRATIAALRAFQRDVRFWAARGTVTGPIVAGVAGPGDATAQLLDRVSVYTVTKGGARVSFRDHIASSNTRSEQGVMFVGTAAPSSIGLAEYQALGLTRGQAAALQHVSSHEGNFDAINTYDRALVSVGFIQFAGSRGLPRYLALLKARRPATFQDLLQRVGIDVEYTVNRGSIDSPRVVTIDPGAARALRGAPAEAAIRDDKRLTAVLILSGRDRDVQLTQIEAAVRDYVWPSLAAVVSWGGNAARAPIGELLRSQKGMAIAFDRAIQEGLGAAKRRIERVIQRIVQGRDPKLPLPTKTDLQAREGDILAEIERDLQAAADVAARLVKARGSLELLTNAAAAAGAAIAATLARPELADARRAVSDAKAGLSAIVNVAPPGNGTVDAALATMRTMLIAEERRLAFAPPPASAADLAAALGAARQALATAAGPVAAAPMFLGRIQRIRRSTLDAGASEDV